MTITMMSTSASSKGSAVVRLSTARPISCVEDLLRSEIPTKLNNVESFLRKKQANARVYKSATSLGRGAGNSGGDSDQPPSAQGATLDTPINVRDLYEAKVIPDLAPIQLPINFRPSEKDVITHDEVERGFSDNQAFWKRNPTFVYLIRKFVANYEGGNNGECRDKITAHRNAKIVSTIIQTVTGSGGFFVRRLSNGNWVEVDGKAAFDFTVQSLEMATQCARESLTEVDEESLTLSQKLKRALASKMQALSATERLLNEAEKSRYLPSLALGRDYQTAGVVPLHGHHQVPYGAANSRLPWNLTPNMPTIVVLPGSSVEAAVRRSLNLPVSNSASDMTHQGTMPPWMEHSQSCRHIALAHDYSRPVGIPSQRTLQRPYQDSWFRAQGGSPNHQPVYIPSSTKDAGSGLYDSRDCPGGGSSRFHGGEETLECVTSSSSCRDKRKMTSRPDDMSEGSDARDFVADGWANGVDLLLSAASNDKTVPCSGPASKRCCR